MYGAAPRGANIGNGEQRMDTKKPSINVVNRFFQAGIIVLVLATFLSLGEYLTGSTSF